jgi:hypothetical protein
MLYEAKPDNQSQRNANHAIGAGSGEIASLLTRASKCVGVRPISIILILPWRKLGSQFSICGFQSCQTLA